METPKAPISVDDLLLPLLRAEADDARRLIERLVVEHAAPVIKQIIRSKLCLFFEQGRHQDAEDLHGEALVQLLARLQAFRSHPAENAIVNFQGYVAVLAYNACHEYIRRKSPHYHQLKNRLRYLMTHHSVFSLWESDKAIALCGLSEWRAAGRSVASSSRLAQINDDPQSFAQTALGGRRPESIKLADLAVEFVHIWPRLPLDDDAIASRLGLRRQQVINLRLAARRRLLRRLNVFGEQTPAIQPERRA
jgi:hypothetical protein